MDDIELAIYKAFFDFIAGCNENEVVYPLNRNQIAAGGSYCTVFLQSIEPSSWTATAEYAPSTTTGLGSSYTQYKGYVSIQTYGDKAVARAQAIASGFREKQLTKILRDKGLGYSSHSPVTDSSVAINAESMERRAAINVSFYFVQGGQDRGEAPSVIETVEFDSTYNDC